MFKPFDRPIVVVDLEWNQNAYKPRYEMPHEIIEIGAVRLGPNLRAEATLGRVIRPRAYPALDRHIREVTGITQAEVDAGEPFPQAFAALRAFCGEGARLCTWGRDDYPVLLRNVRFHGLEPGFEPPLDAQLLYAHLLTDAPGRQVGLHAAMEALGIEPELPAHRAVNDALCTAQVLRVIRTAWEAAPAQALEALERTAAQEARIAASDVRSVPTPYKYQTEAVGDERLVRVRCPVCGGRTTYKLPWFDTGHERYLSLSLCPEHGVALCQMHFKRMGNARLLMHQRAYIAPPEQQDEAMRRFEAVSRTPPRRRRGR